MEYQINNTEELVKAFADSEFFKPETAEEFADDLAAYIEYCRKSPEPILLPILKPAADAYEIYKAYAA